MVDVNKLMCLWLRSSSSITNLLPVRNGEKSIYSVALPDTFKASDGPAIVIAGRGGRSNPETPTIIQPRIQINVWADILKYQLAHQVYGAIFDLIQGNSFTQSGVGTILSCMEVVGPQDLSDADTDWANVVSFYELIARR